MNIQPYLDFTTSVAYRAGRITLGYFNTGIRPDFKADDSPVTAADRAAEQFIRGEIERAYPGHAIVGEEYGESSPSPFLGRGVRGEGKSSFRWIIDPIDGTKSFVQGVPLYGVLIGLEIDGVVQVGAAYFPALDEMLCAADGLGAWWNGRRAHVSTVADISRAVVCLTDVRYFEQAGREAEWDRIRRASWITRGWSDCYGYLLVATGRAEICLDADLKIWDCAPFPVILREAGGFYGSWAGEEGHTFGEALACNAALKSTVLDLMRG
jgi:myo-inositol-1(or 4)-monophosphatase